MRQSSGLKPQDVIVLLKVLLWQDRSWRQLDVANALGMSQSEITFSLVRLVKSGLLDPTKRKPMKLALVEFLIHGLKYVYPAEVGPIGRGTATAHFHGSWAKRLLVPDEQRVVWPDPDGEERGQLLEPLYPSVPFAVKKDPELHEWLALIDALRVGTGRVRKVAADRIREKIGAPAP